MKLVLPFRENEIMGNKNKGVCCGGDYTLSANPVNPNAHQSSPSKRHNANKEVERLQSVSRAEYRINLARFIGNYITDNTNETKSIIGLIYDAIEKFNCNE
jgi:uncharacterized protein YktB (UPF0637 family)